MQASVSSSVALRVLPESAWREFQRAHEERVRAWTDPHQARAARGERHPVFDFLFTYYRFRPAWLRRWHPGPDLALAGKGAREFLRWPEYRETVVGTRLGPVEGVMLEPAALLAHRKKFVTWLRDLLVTVQARPPFFGCYGLHEWAMVYRQAPGNSATTPTRCVLRPPNSRASWKTRPSVAPISTRFASSPRPRDH